jgi:hypothetical protein
MFVIGICGKKFNGKDTIGNYLIEKYHFVKLSFGDPLKCAIREIFQMTDEQLWGNKKEQYDDYWQITPRDLMQFLGTDVFREQFAHKFPLIGNKLWTMIMEKKIIELQNKGVSRVVIPDIRFPNELELLKKYNGLLIKVVRSDIENDCLHSSESFVDTFQPDFILYNTTLPELFKDVDKIMYNC